MLKHYLTLTKPGIVFGNLISVAGGFFLASRGDIDLGLLVATLVGVSLVVASGCVFNNCIDRDIDARMERTRGRALVRKQVSMLQAAAHAGVLGIAGLVVLALFANGLTVWLALSGFAIYVGLYSLYLKRNSVHGTLVGSLSGAVPALAGYCAVSGQFDQAALILLLIFALWQMPHSYAIALFRLDDYRSANIPVLPVVRGSQATRRQILGYTLAFALVAPLLTFSGYTGYGYLLVALLMGGGWVAIAVSGWHAQDERRWARRLFLFSLLVVIALSLAMGLDTR